MSKSTLPQKNCVISGEPVFYGSTIVPFTLWPDSNPLGICHDDVAFRSKFDMWEYKKDAIIILATEWKRNSRNTKNIEIIHDDAYYLITVPKYDSKITIWFLKHAFKFSVSKSIWKAFCTEITSNSNSKTVIIDLGFEKQWKLMINSHDERLDICHRPVDLIKGFQDCITISFTEWLHFLSSLSNYKDLVF